MKVWVFKCLTDLSYSSLVVNRFVDDDISLLWIHDCGVVGKLNFITDQDGNFAWNCSYNNMVEFVNTNLIFVKAESVCDFSI